MIYLIGASPSPVIGELTHLNGLTWVETPALWLDAADTLAHNLYAIHISYAQYVSYTHIT